MTFERVGIVVMVVLAAATLWFMFKQKDKKCGCGNGVKTNGKATCGMGTKKGM